MRLAQLEIAAEVPAGDDFDCISKALCDLASNLYVHFDATAQIKIP